MRITADTNILVRAIAGDDARQGKIAEAELEGADMVAITLPSLCELVWVLARGYKIASAEIAQAVRRLIDADNVEMDRQAVEAGLVLLDAGGDFADGVIAFEGRRLGADTFVTFDKGAATLLAAQGVSARLLD